MNKYILHALTIARWIANGKQLGHTYVVKYGDDAEYNVLLCDEVFMSLAIPRHIPCAMVTGLPFNGDIMPFFVINRAFNIMPIWFKRAVMAHEECHLANEDYHQKMGLIKNVFRSFLGEDEHEKRADQYAYDKVGDDFIEALYIYNALGMSNCLDRIKAIHRN